MKYELVEIDGAIGVVTDWTPSWEIPQFERQAWRFPQENAQDYQICAYRGGSHMGNNVVGFTHNVTNQVARFLCNEDSCIGIQIRPYPQPSRGGKNWKWVYKEGEWKKQWK